MIFATRSRRSAGHLEWRIRLFGAGAILALVGMWAEQRWMINAAIGVLLLGLALRFIGPREEEPLEPREPSA